MQLWNDSGFVRIAIANALSYGAIFAYIAGSPVVIIAQMGLSSVVFAAVFAYRPLLPWLPAPWTSGQLSRQGVSAMVLLNRSLVTATAATLVLAAVMLSGVTSGAIVIPLLLVTLFARGVSASKPAAHRNRSTAREHAGVASAAVGVSQLLAGAPASAVVAFLLQSFGPGALAATMAFLTIGALAVWHETNL